MRAAALVLLVLLASGCSAPRAASPGPLVGYASAQELRDATVIELGLAPAGGGPNAGAQARDLANRTASFENLTATYATDNGTNATVALPAPALDAGGVFATRLDATRLANLSISGDVVLRDGTRVAPRWTVYLDRPFLGDLTLRPAPNATLLDLRAWVVTQGIGPHRYAAGSADNTMEPLAELRIASWSLDVAFRDGRANETRHGIEPGQPPSSRFEWRLPANATSVALRFAGTLGDGTPVTERDFDLRLAPTLFS